MSGDSIDRWRAALVGEWEPAPPKSERMRKLYLKESDRKKLARQQT